MESAIKFKEALKRIPKQVEPIGVSVNDYIDFTDYDENLIINEKDEKLCDLFDYMKERFLEEKYFNTTDVSHIKIKLKGKYEQYQNDNQINWQEVYDNAVDSPFGDMKKMETVVDKNVRCARELGADYFEVTQFSSQSYWNLFPEFPDIKPYKINLYAEGVGFKTHVDTPEPNLIGTMLVCLYDSSDGNLVVNDYKWFPKETSVISFYSDIPHEVTKISTGLRVTLSFKVYANINLPKNINSLRDLIIKDNDKTFGILMNYKYTFDTDGLKGNDMNVYNIFKEAGANIQFMNVIVHNDATYYDDDDFNDYNNFASNVYPLTEEYIKYVLSEGKEPRPFNNNIRFFKLTEGYIWENKCDMYIDHTGNECQPGSINSIYINRAMIISFP